ncbi:MAG: STAS domain-containing protein [Thermoguttaceae bacterium]|nr:STAS domain-containing protein [Thermoguttaceae bacterium]
MSGAKVRIMVRYIDDVAVANCMDTKLSDELGIQAWGEELYALVASQRGKKLVVNFQNVVFMSSSALRVLITLNNKTKSKGISLGLCGINDNIMEAFRITRLDSLFVIRKNELEAAKALK